MFDEADHRARQPGLCRQLRHRKPASFARLFEEPRDLRANSFSEFGFGHRPFISEIWFDNGRYYSNGGGVMFTRRLGKPPEALCAGGYSCPDLLEMESGDFAVIGTDITEIAAGKLPLGSGCGSGERIVRIPRHVLVSARQDIPAAP